MLAQPPPKRFLHIVRSRASSFKWEYPLPSLRSSSSFLHLLPHLLVTSISPFIFPSITCFRRHFLRKMWPIQLAFRFLISCRIFLCSLTLSNTSSFLTWSVQLIFSTLLQHISERTRCFWSAARSVQVSARYKAKLQMLHFTTFFLKFKSNVLVKRFFFLLNGAFAMAILDLISQIHVHFPSFEHATQIFKTFPIFQLFFVYHSTTGIKCLHVSALIRLTNILFRLNDYPHATTEEYI